MPRASTSRKLKSLSSRHAEARATVALSSLLPPIFIIGGERRPLRCCAPCQHVAQAEIVVEPNKPAHLYMVLTVARGGDEYDIVTEAQPGARPNNTRASEIRAGGKVEGFKRVSGTPPAFPVEAAKRGASGTVALFGTVRTDGALAEITPLAWCDPGRAAIAATIGLTNAAGERC